MTLGAVVFGISLSILHQSGARRAVPDGEEPKIHPLWYSELIPVLFFVSSIFAGLALVILEGSLSHRIFHDRLGRRLVRDHDEILVRLARIAAVAMFVYLSVELLKLLHGGSWPMIASGWGAWYLLEVIGFVAVPMLVLLAAARVRAMTWIRVGAALTLVGIVLNRLNIAIIAFKWYAPVHYVPSWQEVVVTLAVISAEIWAFRWIVRRMPVPAPERAGTLASLIALAPETGRATVSQASWLWDSLGEIAGAIETGADTPEPERDTRALTAGLLYAANGQPREAERSWASASTATEAGRLASAFRAEVLARLDRWEQAAALLDTLPEASNPWTEIETATAWSALERFDEAIDSVQHAEMLASEDPVALSEAFLARARVMARMGVSPNVVFEVVRRAAETAPGHTPASLQLYAMSYRVRSDDAERLRRDLLEQAGSLPDSHPLMTYSQAQDLLRSNRANVAYRILREAASEQAPEPSVDQLYFAILNANRTLSREGIQWLEARAKQVPSEPMYTLWRAELLLAIDQEDSARQLLESWLERYPGDDDVGQRSRSSTATDSATSTVPTNS